MPKWIIVAKSPITAGRLPHREHDDELYIEGNIASVAGVPYSEIPHDYKLTGTRHCADTKRVYCPFANDLSDFEIMHT